MTFAGAGLAIAVLEILLLILNDLGFRSSLSLTSEAMVGVVQNHNYFAFQLLGFSQNHNFFAFQLLMALAAVLVAARGQAPRIVLITVLLTAIYFTDSRSSWITVSVVLAVSIYMNASSLRESGIALLCTLGVILPILAVALLIGNATSVAVPTITVATANTATRMLSIIGGLQLFAEHPIMGAGLGAFRQKLIMFRTDQPLLIHSTSVWLLAELGIVGLITFATPAVYALAVELRRRSADPAAQLIVLCLVGFGIMSLPADMLYQRTFWLLFGAALMLKPTLEKGEA